MNFRAPSPRNWYASSVARCASTSLVAVHYPVRCGYLCLEDLSPDLPQSLRDPGNLPVFESVAMTAERGKPPATCRKAASASATSIPEFSWSIRWKCWSWGTRLWEGLRAAREPLVSSLGDAALCCLLEPSALTGENRSRCALAKLFACCVGKTTEYSNEPDKWESQSPTAAGKDLELSLDTSSCLSLVNWSWIERRALVSQ